MAPRKIKKQNQQLQQQHPYNQAHEMGSLGGVARYHRARLKSNQAKKFADTLSNLQALESYTIHKQRNRRFERNPVVVMDSNEQYQADLMDVSGISKENKHRKYALVVIDCFSKRASCILVLNKQGDNVRKAFEVAFKELGHRPPTKLQVDGGKEFWNAPVKNFMTRNDVNMFSSRNPEIKAGMAERMIRTIRAVLARLFRARGNKKFYDVLPQIIKIYNSTVHHSHQHMPAEVNDKNSLSVFNRLYVKLLSRSSRKPVFKPGDSVRVYIDKTLFAKGYMPNFNDEICTIHQVISHTIAPVYIVKTSSGEILTKRFYESELSRVRR